jgi:hypothetical protein
MTVYLAATSFIITSEEIELFSALPEVQLHGKSIQPFMSSLSSTAKFVICPWVPGAGL